MATYKLMQDIEAEDKILGPLTLRQFIFGLVTAFLGYISFIVYAKGYPFLLVVFVPPALLTGFFAFPFGRDQPTEVWALAKLRYWFKPRKRIWNQSGVKELVTITVPKKIEHVFTDGLSQNEVRSRLNALANTIDSRGWAVKNVNLNSYTPNPLALAQSDRLLDMSSIPQAVPDEAVYASDDILDERNNPIAQQFDAMMHQSSQNHRQQLINQMNDTTPPAAQPAANDNQWFMSSPAAVATETPEEAALVAQSRARLDAQQVTYGNLRTIQPTGSQPVQQPDPVTDFGAQTAAQTPAPAVTPQPDPAILALANNNDLNVATIARQAQKTKDGETGSGRGGEVVISLR